jgi:hypothetical protein
MKIGNNDYQTPQQYTEQLEQLNGSIDLLLSDFRKNYVMSKMNPESEDIQQQYSNSVANINQVQSKSFTISNDIQSNIDQISKKLLEVNLLIDIERKRNVVELKKKLGMVIDKNNAATEMIYNYKQMYNENYLRNWALFLSITICIYTISKVYKN